MKTKLTALLVVLIATVSFTAMAKDVTVKGQVTEYSTDEPIIGVSISIKDSKTGTVTDIDGNYTIKVPVNSVLTFNYIGFVSQSIKITEDQTLNVRLKEDNMSLDEVVVPDYDRSAVPDRMSSKSLSIKDVSYTSVPTSSLNNVLYERSEAPRTIKQDNNQISSGQLTATEVNDLKKWDEWTPLLETEFKSYINIWNIKPSKRFVARATDKNQKPIPNATVTLYDASNKAVWTTLTDNTGTAQLWADCIYPNGIQQAIKTKAPYSISFSYNNENKKINNAQPYPQQTNVVTFDEVSKPSSNVDIFFAIDATGSMDDEMTYLQTELYNIIQQIQQNQSNLNLRLGSLVYRDTGDDYITRKSSLNSDINTTVKFLKEQSADGGGDYPEAVDQALIESIEKENWRGDALTRIVFIVLDAPAHQDAKTVANIQKQTELAAKKGIRIVPIIASGMDKNGEYLMRSIALATNGTYVTLTDDSGIGNSHIKPSTDYFKVEKLNDLIVRLVNEYTTTPSTIK